MERSIRTFDFLQATPQNPATIISFHKSAVRLNSEVVGVVFEGVEVSDADKLISDLLRLPVVEPITADLRITPLDASLLLLVRSGYNSRQASELINITHKAANKRLERIMTQLGVTDRKSLLEMMRSELVLKAVYGALVDSSFSLKIDSQNR